MTVRTTYVKSSVKFPNILSPLNVFYTPLSTFLCELPTLNIQINVIENTIFILHTYIFFDKNYTMSFIL